MTTAPTASRFALHGRMLSGKSTVARLLTEQHGFIWANYTDFGKSIMARALATILGRSVPLSEVIARKNEWREFIIAGLRVYGFDQGNGVEALIEQLAVTPDTQLVFDNVRYLSQYQKLQPYGFRLVRLEISDNEQEARARRAGMPLDKLRALRSETSERPLPHQRGEIVIYVDGHSPEDIVGSILRYDTVMRMSERFAGRAGRATA